MGTFQPDLFEADPETVPVEAEVTVGVAVEGKPSAWSDKSAMSIVAEEAEKSETVGVGSEAARAWQEVPQARYASWSMPMQMSYCAARDEASAAREGEGWWADFYRLRAAAYRKQARA